MATLARFTSALCLVLFSLMLPNAAQPPAHVPAFCEMPGPPDFYFPESNLAVAQCPFGTYADIYCKDACAATWTDCKNAAVDSGNAAMQAAWSAYMVDYLDCETESCACFVAEQYEAAIRTLRYALGVAVRACDDAYYNCTLECCLPWKSARVLPPAVPFEGVSLSLARTADDPPEDCNFPPPSTVSSNQLVPAPECPTGYEHDFGCKIVCDANYENCRDVAYDKAMTALDFIWHDRFAIWMACTTPECRCETVSEYQEVLRGVLKEYIRDLGKCSDAFIACCALCCEEIGE